MSRTPRGLEEWVEYPSLLSPGKTCDKKYSAISSVIYIYIGDCFSLFVCGSPDYSLRLFTKMQAAPKIVETIYNICRNYLQNM